MCTHNQYFRAKKKNIIIFHQKLNIFTAVKYCCIVHGCVCIMFSFHHFGNIKNVPYDENPCRLSAMLDGSRSREVQRRLFLHRGKPLGHHYGNAKYHIGKPVSSQFQELICACD